jgi:hypothetical protein
MEPVTVKFSDGYFEIDGLKVSYVILHDLTNPPADRLFSFKRDGDTMLVSSYTDAEGAAKFFQK